MGRWNENNAVAPKHKSSEKLHQNKLLAGVSRWHTVLRPKKLLVNRGSTRYKNFFSLDAPAFNSCLPCFFRFHPSGVKHCPHQKPAKQKKDNIPKNILNPQNAKPPHHVSEATITVIQEHKNRNKQNRNMNKHGTTREPTIGTKMKGGTHEKSQEKDGEEDAPPACTANHSWS